MMSRVEHMAWCKQRAIQEFDFYAKEGLDAAIRNGMTSMMSDINKHPETASNSLQALMLANMRTIVSRQQFVNFINGFN